MSDRRDRIPVGGGRTHVAGLAAPPCGATRGIGQRGGAGDDAIKRRVPARTSSADRETASRRRAVSRPSRSGRDSETWHLAFEAWLGMAAGRGASWVRRGFVVPRGAAPRGVDVRDSRTSAGRPCHGSAPSSAAAGSRQQAAGWQQSTAAGWWQGWWQRPARRPSRRPQRPPPPPPPPRGPLPRPPVGSAGPRTAAASSGVAPAGAPGWLTITSWPPGWRRAWRLLTAGWSGGGRVRHPTDRQWREDARAGQEPGGGQQAVGGRQGRAARGRRPRRGRMSGLGPSLSPGPSRAGNALWESRAITARPPRRLSPRLGRCRLGK